MTVPRATYRLQFRGPVDFERAADLVPYLARLGVSHLYASPLFQASPRSTHGYDVTDFSQFDVALGGDDGFEMLSAALREHNLGLILDIVPNHMAASCHNRWWADVLRHGSESDYAGHFDIDWSRPKLLLPILGRPYGAALAAGEFSLGCCAEGLVWHASGQELPLDPRTWALVLHDFADLDTSRADTLTAGFRQWRGEGENATRLDSHLSAISHDVGRMHEIHEAQNWRLAYWRAARDMLGYRRFFEISDLVGLRVEAPNVFDDVHRFVFALVERGQVDGLRIDHIDGLADPTGYLERLNASLPRPVPVWVEKILGRNESLPADWRIAGATGYEVLAMTSAALTNAGAVPGLNRAYADFCGTAVDYRVMEDAAKREVLKRNLAAELKTLVKVLQRAVAADLSNRDWGPDTLRRATVALLVAMPIYRTYFSHGTRLATDEAVLARAVEEASKDNELDDPAVVETVASVLGRPQNPAASEFSTRFQQVSGALMAKAVEDTLFYRFNRLISANEVGADPHVPAIDADDFHAFMIDRANSHPNALNATATHDTKRGEDARMRIAAISEAPRIWQETTAEFDAALGADASVPEIDSNTRWLFYQALLGSWRPGLADNLRDRISAFLLKAARESKVHTSWVKTNSSYEQRLQKFVTQALSCDAFVEGFERSAAKFIDIGERKSLVQLALKLTLPGIPDIYQGTEIADLNLVDPDNRRPVNFESLGRRLSEIAGRIPSNFSDRKIALLHFGLHLRRAYPDVFAGGYSPLPVDAERDGRIIAFARTGKTTTLIVIADLSGTSTTGKSVSVRTPSDRQLGKLLKAFSLAAAPVEAFPDDRLAPHLDESGVSIQLFSS